MQLNQILKNLWKWEAPRALSPPVMVIGKKRVAALIFELKFRE